jgi:hypothetical protein
MSFSFGIGLNPIQVPNTTGAVRSFPHIVVVIGNNEITGGFSAIKYSRKREREFPMSNDADPIGKTVGDNKYTASITMYFDWWMAQIQALGPGYGDMPFTVQVGYGGQGLPPYTDFLYGCTIDSTEADQSAGNKAIAREMDLGPVKVKFGGLDDVGGDMSVSVSL